MGLFAVNYRGSNAVGPSGIPSSLLGGMSIGSWSISSPWQPWPVTMIVSKPTIRKRVIQTRVVSEPLGSGNCNQSFASVLTLTSWSPS